MKKIDIDIINELTCCLVDVAKKMVVAKKFDHKIYYEFLAHLYQSIKPNEYL